jgi:hypothetical protein
MIDRQQFLTDIDSFLARSGMTQTALGKQALGDGGFMTRLRQGSNVTLATVERVYKFMSDHEQQQQSRFEAHAA